MGTVLTTVGHKGGIGKSTITTYVAFALAERGNKVCVLDLCQNGSISTSFLRDRDEFEVSAYDWLTGESQAGDVIHSFTDNLYFIPSDPRIYAFEDFLKKNVHYQKRLFVVKEKVNILKEHFDYVLIDTHPAEHDPLVTFALVACDYALIPFEPDEDSMLAVNRTVEIVAELIEDNYLTKYFIIGNNVDTTKKNIMETYNDIRQEFITMGVKEESILSYIRATSLIPTVKKQKMTLYDKKNNKYAKKALMDFDTLTNEILNAIEKENENA